MSITKRIFGATAKVTAAQGLVRMFGIVAAPILTSVLGPGPYGTMALIGSVLNLATSVALFGIETSYSRNYFGAENKYKAYAIEGFCWRFAIASSIAIAIISYFVMWPFASGDLGLNEYVLAGVSIAIVLNVVQQMAITRARINGLYTRMSVAMILAGALSLITTIALATYWRQDVWPFLIGLIVGLVTVLSMMGLSLTGLMNRSSLLSLAERKEVLSLGIPAAFTAVMYWVLSSSDRWFIAAFSDTDSVGVYALASSIASIGHMLNVAINLTWQPEAYRSFEEDHVASRVILGRLWTRLAAALLLVWLLVAAAGGDILSALADARFHRGAICIPWLAAGVLFFGISMLANTGLLLTKNIKPSAYIWILGGIVNVLLNIFTVSTWGVLGAAISNCLSYAFVAISTMYVSQRRLQLVIPWPTLIATFLLVFIIGGLMAPSWHVNPIYSMSLKLPLGMIVSAAVMLVIAPDWWKRGTSVIKHKLNSLGQ